jgi:hypothetical protein
MRRTITLPVLITVLLSIATALAQRTFPASQGELAQITDRGRLLAEYDAAAWHATDAIMALKPIPGSVARYIARKNGGLWTVVFGRLNEAKDKFLIVYEATQGASPKQFTVQKHDPPKEDNGFYLQAARALDVATKDFGKVSRAYNAAVLPADAGRLYVYLLPAQTQEGVYPLGGDVRYLVSQTGAEIVEKRQLHNSIIEFKGPSGSQPGETRKVDGGFHTAVLDDVPEDTDVFHVLVRKPSVPEWVATKQYVYRIEPDGAISYVMTSEAFEKIGKK